MNREQRRAWRRDMRRRARCSRKEKGTDMLAKHKWQISTIQILEEVFAERTRQVAQYGHNDELHDGNGPGARWLAPFTHFDAQEIQAQLRDDYEAYEADTGAPTWVHLLREEIAESFECEQQEHLETELLQLAALCVSWVESLRRRGLNPVPTEEDEE